jgi:hypothetical protein
MLPSTSMQSSYRYPGNRSAVVVKCSCHAVALPACGLVKFSAEARMLVAALALPVHEDARKPMLEEEHA